MAMDGQIRPHHSDRANQSKKHCKYYATPEKCRFGINCKFLHVNKPESRGHVNLIPNQSGSKAEATTMPTGKRESFVQWRYSIPLNPQQTPPLGQRLSSFVQTAVSLIDTDPGIMQEIIIALNTEGGILRLKELLDRDFDTLLTSARERIVTTELVPFFTIITHPNVAASIMLEDKVTTIYNYLYGPQGRRGVQLFKFMAGVISGPTSNLRSASTLEIILTTFSKMIDLNGNAVINADLPPIAEALFDICGTLDADDMLQLHNIVGKIGRRLEVGHNIIQIEHQPHQPSPHMANFILLQDPPGDLSPHGYRHDNDQADIANIEILPTFSEIKAIRPPYLPPRDPSYWHISGIKGLLDRHFRLLREDTVGQLRDAVGAALELEQTQTTRQNTARILTYDNVIVKSIYFSRWKGLQILIQVDQPQHLRGLSKKNREEWWNSTRRLQVDSLVCIIGSNDSVTFYTISDPSKSANTKEEIGTGQDVNPTPTKHSDPKFCCLQLQLVSLDRPTITRVLKQLETNNGYQRLVEFPGILLPSFQPTLEAMKRMSRQSELPFGEILVAGAANGSTLLNPPLYASKPGFEFQLKDVTIDKAATPYTIGKSFDLEKFKQNSLLDDAQANALIECLNRSFALIQGPPGTGKSFTGVALIKVLLSIKKVAKLGPILCVCYTNHALDQLLEHLVHHGVDQIIRIGSRSKSEVLERCNLREVVKNMQMTGPEKKERWSVMQELGTVERHIKDLLDTLAEPSNEQIIETYLEVHHPHHHAEIFGSDSEALDNDGFEIVHHGRGGGIREWMNGRRYGSSHIMSRSIESLKQSSALSMNYNERNKLYNFWIQDIKQTVTEQLIGAISSHEDNKAKLDRIRHEQNLRCLQAANIVGVTTTGLARQLDLLRNLRSKVLVCEEAGEVLEAHILTALLPSLEHVVLIGDHLQLPPHIQNYDLSRANPRGEQYSLDRSLFERLVEPDNPEEALPFSILETQRRMHPSISNLIRSTLYPQLKDSPQVNNYPGVAGMKKRLFWLDHREPEAGSDSSQLNITSHSNDLEVQMVVALVTHLVRQGVYAANEIAVLTPYLGQLHKIRKIFRNQFEITMNERDLQEMERQGITDDNEAPGSSGGVVAKTALLKALAISTVDNFQGEEAKVVVISLVRSNSQNKCGFLRTSNRINVLLSRAKHGMYIIGNSETSKHVEMWSKVISMLQQDGNFGSQLELECPRHPETTILVSKPDDFVIFSPEGGCNKTCDKRLNCGHRDQSKCHSETLHHAVKCLEPCPRQLKDCKHGCPNLCGESCVDKCRVVLDNLCTELPCGHIKTKLACWQTRDLSAVKCQTLVEKVVPGCRHKVKVDCYVDVMSPLFVCNAECGSTLTCDHRCKKSCHLCTTRSDGTITSQNHGDCLQICGRKFNSCSHSCQDSCHGNLPCVCRAPCENICEHSKCGKRCNEPCAPCASITCNTGRCPHTTSICSMPCSVPCDWLPCAKRCENFLDCGHQCPTVCGEICPSSQYCQVCADSAVKQQMVDFIMMTTYEETDLDEDPIVIPRCGHILTISSMDGQMEMSKHYRINENVITGIQRSSKPFSADELKVCGTCRGSLRNITRYGRIVRRAVLDESTKKFIQWAGQGTITLTTSLHQQQQLLTKSLDKVPKSDSNKKINIKGTSKEQQKVMFKEGGARHTAIRAIRHRITEHLKKVEIEEQPYKRVWDLVLHAQQRKRNIDLDDMKFDTSVLQTRETIKVTALLIRCDLILLSDFVTVNNEAEIMVDLSDNRTRCLELIKIAWEGNQPLHVVEGHIFFAQFCVAENKYAKADQIDDLANKAKEHITEARSVCQKFTGSTSLITSELEEVEKMIRSSTFYTPMVDSEWKDVLEAMSREFRGTGHWYRCANGHPFTIGECGMPMEQARCPQCDAPIGGSNHQAVAGVRAADDLERGFGQLHI